MRSDNTPLRTIVAKWLAPTDAYPLRVASFGRTGDARVPYVCIRQAAASIFFFRHGDGSWCVFPPASASRASSPWSTQRPAW
jgi:hypothetical protein